MINQFFLDSLEYSVSKALTNSRDEIVRGYWCDGVIVYELDKGQELTSHVLQHKSLKAVGIIPKGQYEEPDYRFDMRILFGKEALSRLNEGQDLDSAIPEPSNSDWITFDLKEKTITVQLK